MPKDSFDFKQFTINQSKCAMKVGTDGVLLGSWAELNGFNVLDVGTGTGVISLMIAQRYAKADIDAIDIDYEAMLQAQENFEASPWQSRLHAKCEDLRLFNPHKKYDLIVSNPPFYTNSPKSSSIQRDRARKATPDFFKLLIEFSANHLSPKGSLNVIIPSGIASDFEYSSWENGLYLQKQLDIITKQGKKPKRTMLSFVLYPCSSQKNMLELLDSDGNFSETYQLMTKDFYLDK